MTKAPAGKIPFHQNKKYLQMAVAFLALIALGSGGICFFLGPAFLPGGSQVNASVASEFRFVSAYWMGMALILRWILPQIEKQTELFRMIILINFIGGVGRLIAVWDVGWPHPFFVFAIFIELVVVPLLIPWQASVARSSHG